MPILEILMENSLNAFSLVNPTICMSSFYFQKPFQMVYMYLRMIYLIWISRQRLHWIPPSNVRNYLSKTWIPQSLLILCQTSLCTTDYKFLWRSLDEGTNESYNPMSEIDFGSHLTILIILADISSSESNHPMFEINLGRHPTIQCPRLIWADISSSESHHLMSGINLGRH